jgi:N-acetylneuraminate synthase
MNITSHDLKNSQIGIGKTKTYVVCEIGINHNGILDNALKLIDISAISGCSCVKFQKRNPEICVPEHQKNIMRETPWGRISYIDYRHKVEFGRKEYDVIDKYCKERNIDWTASVWDSDSLEFLMSYDVPFIKIPSAMLTNEALILEACRTDKDIWISTGMSLEEEADKAVELLRDNANNFLVMHCNSSYPSHVDDLNLRYIQTLKNRYNCRVGYSGHEFELVTSISAVVLGAEVLERHITLDRTQWGSDQLASVEPHGLMALMDGINKVERAMGDGKKHLYESELAVRKKLRGD